MAMEETGFRYRAADALNKLNDIISKVDRKASPKVQVIPRFLSLDYSNYENQWHYNKVTFQCSIEYDSQNVDSQIEALHKIGILGEHIANEEKNNGWGLPSGRSITTKWHKDPNGDYHLQVTEQSVVNPLLSSPKEGGGFTFGSGLPIQYEQMKKPTVGLLVGYRYRCRKEGC